MKIWLILLVLTALAGSFYAGESFSDYKYRDELYAKVVEEYQDRRAVSFLEFCRDIHQDYVDDPNMMEYLQRYFKTSIEQQLWYVEQYDEVIERLR